MKPRMNVLTLAVDDVERSLDFYRRLGLESPGIVGTEFVGDDRTPGGTVAMFELDGGLLLSLYSRADLAKDAAIGRQRAAILALCVGDEVLMPAGSS